jgi:hypothetical protein
LERICFLSRSFAFFVNCSMQKFRLVSITQMMNLSNGYLEINFFGNQAPKLYGWCVERIRNGAMCSSLDVHFYMNFSLCVCLIMPPYGVVYGCF